MTCNLIQYVYSSGLRGLGAVLGAGNTKGNIRQGPWLWVGWSPVGERRVSATKGQRAECNRRGVYKAPWSTEQGDSEIAFKSTFRIQPPCKLGTTCNAWEVMGRTLLPFHSEHTLSSTELLPAVLLASGGINTCCFIRFVFPKRLEREGGGLHGLWPQPALF